jgi:3-oxoisoapionate kinase
MRAALLGWYGDDFTGATDTLAVLAQAGLRAMLFLGVPSDKHRSAAEKALSGPLQAVGIAGASRSMSPTAMRAELQPVGEFFAALGTAVLHYKVCSTFDSAPAIGSIGVAVDVLRRYVRNPFVPIVGGQPNLGRYCAFSNLFAAAGAGGAVERIDRHPTMRNHPVTPMLEADLRRHLALQGLVPMAAVHYPVYSRPFAAQQGLLQALLDDRPSAVLFDVATPEHLATVGRLVWQRAQMNPLLAVGPSGVAQALIAHWSESGELQRSAEPERQLAPADAPVFVFAGSLSPVTAAQVRAARSFEPMAIDAGALLGSPASANEACDQICRSLSAGRHLLAYTAPDDRARADTGQSAALARATAAMVNTVVHQRAAQGTPLSRVGIAGGDTSSLAVKALGGWGLSYKASLGAGVTVSTLHSDELSLDGLELMLKGGQMGDEGVFERLIGPSV